MNQASQIINHLHAGGQFGHYWTAQDKRSTWFPAGSTPPPSSHPRDTYFGVHPTAVIPPTNRHGQSRPPSAVRSQIKHLAAINCLFSEFDAANQNGAKRAILDHIEGLPVLPSVIIDSGGGYHCYYLLNEPFHDIEKARDYQYRWVKFTGGDGGSKDLARVLRVPGTRNLKKKYSPNFPTVTVVECDLRRGYKLIDLLDLMPPPEPRPEAPRHTRPLPALTGDEQADHRARYWAQALDTACDMIADAADGEKHTRLLEAAHLLGGYIAGGMGDKSDATDTLRAAIEAKANVESLGAAYTTIDDGIRYGQGEPITFEQKERERLAWREAHPVEIEYPPWPTEAPSLELADYRGPVVAKVAPGDREYWTQQTGAWGAMR